MTDNGSAYRFRRFAKALRLLAIRHIFTRPYTPKANGKAERFIQTLLRELACALPTPLRKRAPPTCRDGLTGSTEQDHTPHSLACHPFQG
jgi:transposase InsO family protein